MNERIVAALTNLFERHRIVFWYDARRELRPEFETLELPGVAKVEIRQNEYGLKYRVLREEPQQKFLLYHDGPQPPDLEHWLLDVLLAHGEFRTDQAAVWLSELELGYEFIDVVEDHPEFFQAARRRETLKRLLKPDDGPGRIRMKMLAVCAGSDTRLEAILESLLTELAGAEPQTDAQGRAMGRAGEKFKLIGRCGLEKHIWEQMRRVFGYESAEPSIHDFVIQLFKDTYYQSFSSPVRFRGGKIPESAPSPVTSSPLSSDAQVFLKNWKDSRQHAESFEMLSTECADILGVENDLNQRDFRELVDLDCFRLIDQKILSELIREVTSQTVPLNDVIQWVRQRQQGHWYPEFQNLYEAIQFAARFFHALNEIVVEVESLTDGIQRYSRAWFALDQHYRKFIHHARQSGAVSLLSPLIEKVENHYVESYLRKLSDHWQPVVDATPRWEAAPVPLQRDFFEQYVRPFLKKDNKVGVIISDALRFEIADELLSLIRREDRYEAELEPLLSMLPSTTQLGMAALLPNRELAFAEDESGSVLVDGQSARGTANRDKILRQALSGRAAAMKSEKFLGMKGEDCRALLRDLNVLYLYHNRIDATGDKRETEEQVFETVETALEDFIRLIKKLTAANLNNLLVTADHGFLYQHRPIAESDFCGSEPTGDWIGYRDRRFVLGKGLKEQLGLRKYTVSNLGLTGAMEVQIPKSILRLRLQGSGSRYVHGGATLQEVVIPVLKINKKRQSDLSVVEVEIIRGSTSVITSGQLAVVFYQTQAVTDKVQPRILRAGIFTQGGELISDSRELSFDRPSENPREREISVRFVLKRQAAEVNNQDVFLRLEEKLTGTTHYKEYKSLRYELRRSFTADFDF